MGQMIIKSLEDSKEDFRSYKGNTSRFSMILRTLLGFDMILSAYIPIAIFSIVNTNFNLTAAYISTFFWGLFCQFYFHFIRKIFDPISMIFVVYSICKLFVLYFISIEILLTYSTILECIIFCVIIVVLNFMNMPLWQLFAEKAYPRLLEWKFRNNYYYKKVWKEISNFWFVAFVFKAIIIYVSMKNLSSRNLGYIYVILGTPFSILIIALGICYPKYRWKNIFYKNNEKTLTKRCS